jgi:hypothetical protein
MATLETYPELLAAQNPLYEEGFLARSPYLASLFAIPMVLSGLSWAMDGVPPLTDFAFLLLTGMCLVLLIRELVVFPRRFGVGGILLFGGVLVWFCHDYLWNWLGASKQTFMDKGIPTWVIAKSAFYHSLFIMCMVIGLRLRKGAWLSNLFHKAPEPRGSGAYGVMLLCLFVFGISPYFIFTVDPWYIALYKSVVSGRSEFGAGWTVGRTGNLNYNWGGYVAQIIDIGYISGIVGAFYAIMIARSLPAKAFGWFCWVVWMALGFGTGTRGQVVRLGLPAVVFLYIGYQAKAAELLRHSKRAYIYASVVVVLAFLLVQIQATFRNTGFLEMEMESVELAKPQGNHMFSEGLRGFYLIPEVEDFFYNRFPGQGLVFAIPNTVWNFVIGPIPRALWTSKPVDPAWAWHNRIATGQSQENYEGTTVALGLVGHWYARYGFFGVLQGGIFVGWMMRAAERGLQQNNGKSFALLLSVAFSAWLFALYRDINFSGLYPIIFAAVLMIMIIPVLSMFGGGAADQTTLAENQWPQHQD